MAAKSPSGGSPELIKTRIEWSSRERHQQIAVVGSWTGFSEFQDLQYCGKGIYAVELMIPKGERYYRYLIDDDWETDDQLPKTILHGDEYNVIQVGEDDDDEEDDERGDALIMQGGSFVVGKSKKTGRRSKRGRGRPSMEINLPENFIEDTMDQMATIAEDGDETAEQTRRRKKRKRKRRRKPKQPRGFENVTTDQNLQELFKQKEEEWARMCFVQQLRQQQQHNDEINRVKTLWKQERQVRVEMHKKVMQQKKKLESNVNQLEANIAKKSNSDDVSSSTDKLKLQKMKDEQKNTEKQRTLDQQTIQHQRQQITQLEEDHEQVRKRHDEDLANMKTEMQASAKAGQAKMSKADQKKVNKQHDEKLQQLKDEHNQEREKLKSRLAQRDEENQDIRRDLDDANAARKAAEDDALDKDGKVRELTGQVDIDKGLWEKEKAALESQVQASRGQGDKIVARCKHLAGVTKTIRKHITEIKNAKIDEMQQMNQFFPNVQELLVKAFSFNQNLVEDLMERYKRELSLRRKYFNMVQDLRGNIRVFCRCRPLLPFEKAKGYTTGVKANSLSGDVRVNHDEGGSTKKYDFNFDKVFDTGFSQEDIGLDTSEYVISTMDGYNVSIFAYGQTGSGKTFTMDGPENDTNLANKGVNYRALRELFRISKERAPMFEYTIKVSVMEIYNENIHDLLSDAESKLRKKLKGKAIPKDTHKIRMNDRGHVYADHMTEEEVTTEEQVLNLVSRAKKNRTTSATDMNAHSSRGHMILVVDVQGFNIPANIEYRGKLFLVDLAGSERIKKSGATGAALKEAQNINKSLSALGSVMNSLQNKSKHVPYRDSTLTHLMQNALGGNAKTIMFVNICPTKQHTSETICSLQFAQRVSKVELGKAKASKSSKKGGRKE